jgi:hypothetical protein
MADNQNIRTALEGLGSFTQPPAPEAIPQEAPAPMMQEIPQGGPQGGPTPQPPAPTPAPALSPVQEAVIKTTEAEAAKPTELSPLQNILMATGLVEDRRPVEPVKDQGPYVPPPQTIEELTGRPEPLQSGIAGEVSSAVLGGVESAGRQAVNAFSFFFPGIAEKLIDQRDPDTGQPMRTLSTDPKDFVASPKTEAGRFVADLIGQGIAAFGVGKVGTLATQVKGLGTAGKVIRGAGAALSTEKAVGWEAKALAYMTSNGVENLFQDMVDTRPDAVMTLESLMGLADKNRVIRSIRDVNNVDDLQTYVMRKMDVFATGAVVGTAVGVTFEKILGGLSKIVTGSLLKRAPEVMEKFPDDFRDSSGKLIPVADGVTQRGDDLISEGLDDLVDARVKMSEPPKPPKPEVTGGEPTPPKGAGGEEPPAPPEAPAAAADDDWNAWRNKRAERTVEAVLRGLGRETEGGYTPPGLIKQINAKLKELKDYSKQIGGVEVTPEGRKIDNMPFELEHRATADLIEELSTKFDELMDAFRTPDRDPINLPSIRKPDGTTVPITEDDFKKAVIIMYRDMLAKYSESFADPMQLVRALSRAKIPNFFVDSPSEFKKGGKAVLALHDVFATALNKFNPRELAEVDKALNQYQTISAARDVPWLEGNERNQLFEALVGGGSSPKARIADHLVNMTIVKDLLKKTTDGLEGINLAEAAPDDIANLFEDLVASAQMLKAIRQQGALPVVEGRAMQTAGMLPMAERTAKTTFEVYSAKSPEELNRRITEMVEKSEQLQGYRNSFLADNKTNQYIDELEALNRQYPDPTTMPRADRIRMDLIKTYLDTEAMRTGIGIQRNYADYRMGVSQDVGVLARDALLQYQRRIGDVIIRLSRAGVLNNADIKNLDKDITRWKELLTNNQYGFMMFDLLNGEQRRALENIQAINDIFLDKARVKGELPLAADIPSQIKGEWSVDKNGELTPTIHTAPEKMAAIEAELENMLSMHEGAVKTPTFEAGTGREGGMFKGEAKPIKDIVEQQNISNGPQIRRLLDRFAVGSLKARVLMSQLTVLYANTIGTLIDEIGGATYSGVKFMGAGFKTKNMDVDSRLALWRAKQTAGLSASLELVKVAFLRMMGRGESVMTPRTRAMAEAFRTGRPTVTRPQTVIEEAITRTQTARGVTQAELQEVAAPGLMPPTEDTILTQPSRYEQFLGGATAAESAIPGTLGKALALPERIASFGPKSMAFIDEFFKQRAFEIEYKAAAITAFLKKHGASKTFEEAEAFAAKEWNDIYNKSVLQTEAEIYKRAARNIDASGKFNKADDPVLYSMAVELEYRRVLTEMNQNVDDVPEWLSGTTRQIREFMDYQASTLDYKNNEAGALLKLSRGGGGVVGMAAKTLIMFPQTAVNELVKAGDLFITPMRLIGGMPKVAGSVAEWEKVAANRVSPTMKELMHPDAAVRSRAKARMTFAGILVASGVGYGAYREGTKEDTVREVTGVGVREPSPEEAIKGQRLGVDLPEMPLGPASPYSERVTAAQQRLGTKPGTIGTVAIPVVGPVFAASTELGAALVGLGRLVGLGQNEMTAPDKPGQFSEIGERLVLIADYLGSDDFIDPIKNALKNPENIPAEMARGMFSPALGGTPLLGLIVEMAGDYKYDNRAELDYFEGPKDESPVQRMIKIAADKGRVKRTKEGLKVQSPMLRDFMRSILKYRGRDLLDAFGDGTDTQDPEANRAVFDGLVASGWAIESIPRLMSDPSYKSPNIGQIDLKKFKMADGRSAYEHIADFVAYGSKDFVGTQATNVAERNNPEGWIGGKFNKTLIQVMQDEFFAKLPPDWKASDFDLSLTARKDDAKYTRTKQQMDRLNLLLRSRYEVALRLIIDQSEVEKAEAAQKGITRKSLKSDFANIPGATR